jgi:tRNA 2-thiouridine synthesizing protein E
MSVGDQSHHSVGLATDDEGYLLDLRDWNDRAAEQLAEQEGISLSEAHWEILWLLRDYYARFELSPANRALVNFVRRELADRKVNSAYLMKLFGGSPAKMAAKLAGLPKPDNCL